MPLFPTTRFHFGKVIRGSVIEHEFPLINGGPGVLRIGGLFPTAPLVVIGAPEQLEPGAEGTIRVSLDTSKLSGPFEGEVLVAVTDPAVPAERLSFRGEVYPFIELLHARELAVTGHRGEPNKGSVEIVSHEPEPLRILQVEHRKERFVTELETLEDGKRYRLTLTLNPKGLPGKHKETISLATSSEQMPIVELTANTELRERVWVSPQAVSFGRIPIGLFREAPGLAQLLSRRLTIHHAAAAGFELELRADLPFLDLRLTRTAADAYEATVRLIAENLLPGPFAGFIYVHTNDPEVPRLMIPVTGTILGQVIEE